MIDDEIEGELPEGWGLIDGTKNDRPKKGSKREEIQARRKKIQLLRRQHNLTVDEIAKTLGVHENTIKSDIRSMSQENRERAVSTEAYEEIGNHIATLEEIEALAMQDYHKCKEGDSKRNQFLRTAMDARKDIIALQTQAGLISRVVDEFSGKSIMDLMKAPTDELERRRKELIATLSKEKPD